MRLKKLLRLIPMIICFTLLIGLTPIYADDNTSYDHTYVGSGERGFTVDNVPTMYFILKNTDNTTSYAYCVDRATTIRDNCKYSRVNVGDADYYSEENAQHIRAIIQNAYPFESIDSLRNKCGISDLSTKEAITATQLAIWHYANSTEHNITNNNVKQLYNWYVNLAPASVSTAPIGKVELNTETSKSGETFTSIVRFKTDAKNVDGSNVNLVLNTSKDIKKEYPQITRTDDGIINGYNQVTFSNIPADASFDFIAQGTQNVCFDGYFYSPQGGRSASQSLVGAHIGDTNISNSIAFTPDSKDSGAIKIVKIDSVSGDSLAGAVFEIARSEDFSGTVYTVTTGADGTAVQGGLESGRWFVRETKAPDGYISYEKPFSVSVGSSITVAECKNTPYGAIEILKSDENNNPVKGAEFSIFAGDSIENKQPLYTSLSTDESGLFLQNNIKPGTYTVVETKAPDGYHINAVPVTITVKPGERATVNITDETVKPGFINLYKKDAVSHESLSGSVIGVYSDPEFNNLIAELTTSSEGAVSTDALAPGTYYVKELSAPDGYLNDTQPQTVEVPEGGTVDVTFYNNPIPKTAGNYALFFIIGLSMIGGCSIITILFRKHLIRH